MINGDMLESLHHIPKSKLDEDTDIVEDEVKVELVPESYFSEGNVKL